MQIDKNEVLRYLGCGSTSDPWIQELVDECIMEIKKYAERGLVYRVFDIETFENKVKIVDSIIEFEGYNISEHLRYSTKCAVMTATLGAEVDRHLRYYKKVNIAKAIVFDACGSAAVESICDLAEKEICSLAYEKFGLGITSRYSPGYGDFPLSIQPQIISILNASIKIGLTSTDNYVLLPSKSVTAIIGLTNQESNKLHNNCEKCNIIKSCAYKRGGDFRGH